MLSVVVKDNQCCLLPMVVCCCLFQRIREVGKRLRIKPLIVQGEALQDKGFGGRYGSVLYLNVPPSDVPYVLVI